MAFLNMIHVFSKETEMMIVCLFLQKLSQTLQQEGKSSNLNLLIGHRDGCRGVYTNMFKVKPLITHEPNSENISSLLAFHSSTSQWENKVCMQTNPKSPPSLQMIHILM